MLFLSTSNPANQTHPCLELYQSSAHDPRHVALYKENPFKDKTFIHKIFYQIKSWWQGGRLALEVTVESQKYFVKVKDLSRAIGFKVKNFYQIIKGKDLNVFLAHHNLHQILKDQNSKDLAPLSALAQRIGYRSIRDTLAVPVFKRETLLAIMTNVGGLLKQNHSLQNESSISINQQDEDYEIVLEEKAIKVARWVKENHQLFKYSFNSKCPQQVDKIEMTFKFLQNCPQLADQIISLALQYKSFRQTLIKLDEVFDLSKPTYEEIIAFSCTRPYVLDSLLSDVNRSSTPEDKKRVLDSFNLFVVESLKHPKLITSLIKEVNVYLLITLIRIRKNEALKLMNTFKKIAERHEQESKLAKKGLPIYEGRQKNPPTFAFSIDQNNQFYVFFGKESIFKRGHFKVVSRGVCLQTSNPFVRIKVYNKNSEAKASDIDCRISLLKEIYERREAEAKSKVSDIDSEISLFNEFYKKLKPEERIYFTDLFQRVTKPNVTKPNHSNVIFFQSEYKPLEFAFVRSLPLIEQLQILEDMMRGITVIHKAGYVHCDIKPGNFLLGKDENQKWRAIVTDFGGVVLKGELTKCMTLNYAPSKAIAKDRVNYYHPKVHAEEAFDRYSFGVMLLVYICPVKKPITLIKQICQQHNVDFLSKASTQEELNKLIQKIYQTACVEHPVSEKEKKVYDKIFTICQNLLKLDISQIPKDLFVLNQLKLIKEKL